MPVSAYGVSVSDLIGPGETPVGSCVRPSRVLTRVFVSWFACIGGASKCPFGSCSASHKRF